ncbi:MAG: response regulator transcription factor [Bacteroidetes bacterium]|nr:response regulator transcription factor [Bacteroidota bacterium]
MIELILAEDNNNLAMSIKEKLELFDNKLKFKGRAVNGEDLLKLLEEDHNVDVILMDIEMPKIDGIEAASLVTAKFPCIKILMLTVFDDEDKIFRAIQAGAMGYLLKDVKPAELMNSIQMIVEGGAPMSPAIAAKTLGLLKNPGRINRAETKEEFELSEREIEVLVQLSQGLDYKEIAENLFISPSTVRKHIENIYRKLQVNNKMKAVKKALKHNII